MTTKGQRRERHDDRAMEMILTGALATGVGAAAEVGLQEGINELERRHPGNGPINPGVRRTIRLGREALEIAEEVTRGGKALTKAGIREILKPRK